MNSIATILVGKFGLLSLFGGGGGEVIYFPCIICGSGGYGEFFLLFSQ